MIRLFYNTQGEIVYAVTKEAASDMGLPFIDWHDPNIRINEWRVQPETKQLTPVEVVPFSRFR